MSSSTQVKASLLAARTNKNPNQTKPNIKHKKAQQTTTTKKTETHKTPKLGSFLNFLSKHFFFPLKIIINWPWAFLGVMKYSSAFITTFSLGGATDSNRFPALLQHCGPAIPCTSQAGKELCVKEMREFSKVSWWDFLRISLKFYNVAFWQGYQEAFFGRSEAAFH